MSDRPTDAEAAPDEPADPPTLAGEYVLGVLDLDEMREVRARARADRALADAIARWEGYFVPLAQAIAPLPPPPALWARIAEEIRPVPAEPANDTAPTVVVTPRRSGRARPWQIATAIMAALAAAFAVVTFLPHPAPEPLRLAAIAPVGAASPAFVVDARSDGSMNLTAVAPAAVPPGRDLELWELPPGAQRVASLGVLPADGTSIHLASVPATGTQLLVSLEPSGGSPTGQPTGPVLYAGTLASR